MYEYIKHNLTKSYIVNNQDLIAQVSSGILKAFQKQTQQLSPPLLPNQSRISQGRCVKWLEGLCQGLLECSQCAKADLSSSFMVWFIFSQAED